jgi:hypothetical protein
VGNAEGKIRFFQYSEGLLAEPRFISELKGMANPFRTREGGEKDAEFL